eukprot:TRINITY_DN30825_c0_g1_i1.p1 TRINITY_DN30825_c0_g1~~TRINITY_DN30825_c0_g1_i1.p1  ORF type:complete len:406 (+),score=74.18 TRINITY_DN30825_c0_g1_i1:48-1220(+)
MAAGVPIGSIQEPDDAGDETAGLLGDEDEEHTAERRQTDLSFAKWFAVATLLGPFAFPLCLHGNGRIANLSTGRAAGGWLGCSAGVVSFSIGLYVLGLRVVFPHKPHHGSSVSWYEVGRDVWLFATSMLGCVSAFLYWSLHRWCIHLIDPGPPTRIAGVRGHVGVHCVMVLGDLFCPAGLRDAAAEGPAEKLAASEEVRDVIAKLNKYYRRAGIGPAAGIVVGTLAVMVMLLLWRHTSHAAHREFSVVDAFVPLLILLSFFVSHLAFSCAADREITLVNRGEEFLKANLALVLWRTPVTRTYSLWIVRRNPHAIALRLRNNDHWWELFWTLDTESRTAAPTLLLCGSRWNRQGSAKALAPEILLEILSYVARPNRELAMHHRHMRRPLLL